MVDLKQVPDEHGLSIDSLRGSEHFIDQPVFANENGVMQQQPREPLSFHERYHLERVGRAPEDAPEESVDAAPEYAPVDRVANLEADVKGLLERPTLSADEFDTLTKRLASLEHDVRRIWDHTAETSPVPAHPSSAPLPGETAPHPSWTQPEATASRTETPQSAPGPETPLHAPQNASSEPTGKG